MLSLFQLFKIIFGIIISAVVLIIVLNFSSNYLNVGESSSAASSLIGLKKAMGDVQTLGIPTDYRIPNADEVVNYYRPPVLYTSVAPLNLEPMPVIFRTGEDLAIFRNEIDLGWWKFQYVEAMPSSNVIISPLKRSDLVFNTWEEIIKSFPSTENVETKIFFGFGCNITDDSKFLLGDWEREWWLDTALPVVRITPEYQFKSCSMERLSQLDNLVLVSISETFQKVNGTLIVPYSDESGYVYLNTSNPSDHHLYKNGMDIITLLIGGEELYTYFNEKFLRELDLAADMKIREIGLIMGKVNPRCVLHYSDLRDSLSSLKSVQKGNIEDQPSMDLLVEKMTETKQDFDDLQMEGCD